MGMTDPLVSAWPPSAEDSAGRSVGDGTEDAN